MGRPPTESQSCMGVLMALMWQLFKGSCLTLCFQAYQVSWSNMDPQTRSRIKKEEEFSLHRTRHVKQSGKSPLGIPRCQWLETHHTSGSILYKRRHDEHYIPDRGSHSLDQAATTPHVTAWLSLRDRTAPATKMIAITINMFISDRFPYFRYDSTDAGNVAVCFFHQTYLWSLRKLIPRRHPNVSCCLKFCFKILCQALSNVGAFRVTSRDLIESNLQSILQL